MAMNSTVFCLQSGKIYLGSKTQPIEMGNVQSVRIYSILPRRKNDKKSEDNRLLSDTYHFVISNLSKKIWTSTNINDDIKTLLDTECWNYTEYYLKR